MKRNWFVFSAALIIVVAVAIISLVLFNKENTLLVAISEDRVGYKEGQHIFLHLASQENYPSQGYKILAQKIVDNNQIVINLQSRDGRLVTEKPAVMTSQAVGRALTAIDLGKLSGLYDLHLNLDKRNDLYQLNITDSKIEVSAVKTRFSRLTEKKYLNDFDDSIPDLDIVNLKRR